MADLRDLFDSVVADTDALFLFSPSNAAFDRYTGLDQPIIVIGPENTADAENYVELPIDFTDLEGKIRFGIEGALEQAFINEDDEIVCVTDFLAGTANTVLRVGASEFSLSGVYDLFVNSRAEPGVIRDVFEVAIELGKKGQKGKPVGALFVVGDAGNVMNKSRPLSYNPFEKSHVHVGDPIVHVMLKEFSRLDGAFVISDAGKIVSAYRYLEPSAEGVDIPKGLGARHMAGGAITRDTNATSIVLSESDGLVRAFKAGELVLEIDPEEY
jgi:DNA integrity scanning protein DisA with diadenylate cyclase activity